MLIGFALAKKMDKSLSNRLDDNSVENILVRLPVKSLVRFKSVSKTWESFIEEDSSFIESHLSLSKAHPQLVISRYNGKTVQLFSPKDGFQGGEAVHRVTLPWVLDENVPRPIHGLFCFIDESDTATRIYNLGTRQVTPWAQTAPVPLQWMSAFDVMKTPTYGFGFDPSTKTYKLVYVLEIPEDYFSTSSKLQLICQVLTVGRRGNQWRNIDEVPPVRLFESAGVYAKASIYWRNDGADSFTPPDKELIVAFDVGSEKFRVIQIPDFIVGPPEILEDCAKRNEKFTVTSIDGHVALIDRVDACVVKLWISDDDSSNVEKKMRTTNWSEETILLPCSFKEEKNLYVHPVQGTDEIVIQTRIQDDMQIPRGSVSLNIYNRRKKSFQMIDITGITPLLRYPYDYNVHCVNESLLPVEDAEKKPMV